MLNFERLFLAKCRSMRDDDIASLHFDGERGIDRRIAEWPCRSRMQPCLARASQVAPKGQAASSLISHGHAGRWKSSFIAAATKTADAHFA